MSNQYEIEFKNMLSKDQYLQLLKEFSIKDDQILRQANHYLDTKVGHLKNLSSALRIREKKNRILCTLKERTAEHTHLETTDVLTEQQRDEILSGQDFNAPSVKEKLLQLKVPIEDLHVFGSIITDRVEVDFEGGTLVFDHSFYLHRDDYEIEYESNNVKSGKELFLQFLQERNIPIQPAENKIARFMKAFNEKGNM